MFHGPTSDKHVNMPYRVGYSLVARIVFSIFAGRIREFSVHCLDKSAAVCLLSLKSDIFVDRNNLSSNIVFSISLKLQILTLSDKFQNGFDRRFRLTFLAKQIVYLTIP